MFLIIKLYLSISWDLSPQEADATKRFGLWKRKLEIYLRALEATEEEKFNILINRLGLNSYEYVNATVRLELRASKCK